MKKLQARLKNGSTHDVLDIRKGEDGLVTYLLEGIDGPIHHKDVEDVHTTTGEIVATPVDLKKGSNDEARSRRIRTSSSIQEHGPTLAPGTLGSTRMEGMSDYQRKMYEKHGVPYDPTKLYDPQGADPLRAMDNEELLTHYKHMLSMGDRFSDSQKDEVASEMLRRSQHMTSETGQKEKVKSKESMSSKSMLTDEDRARAKAAHEAKGGIATQFGVMGTQVPSVHSREMSPEAQASMKRISENKAQVQADIKAKTEAAKEAAVSKLLSYSPAMAHKVYTSTPEHHRKTIHDLVDVDIDRHPEDPDVITGVRFKRKGQMAKGEVENPDGSITRFPGDEQLKKPVKKSIKEKWSLLKAELDNNKAFSSLLGGEEDEQDDEGDQSPVSGDAEGEGGGGDEPNADAGDDGAGSGAGDAGEDTDTATQQDEGGDEGEEAYDEQAHIEAMKQEGYSDAEIAYILHGHVPSQPSKEELKHADAVQDLQHKDASHSQDLDHAEAHHDVELDHKKRMSDLEYEHAQKEKALRLKFLEEELAAKVAALKAKSKGE